MKDINEQKDFETQIEEQSKIIERLRHENERLRVMCRLLTENNNNLYEINRMQFDVLTREIVENGL